MVLGSHRSCAQGVRRPRTRGNGSCNGAGLVYTDLVGLRPLCWSQVRSGARGKAQWRGSDPEALIAQFGTALNTLRITRLTPYTMRHNNIGEAESVGDGSLDRWRHATPMRTVVLRGKP